MVMGPNNSLNMGGHNGVTIGEALTAVLGLMEVLNYVYTETSGTKTEKSGMKFSYHGLVNKTHGHHIETHGPHAEIHGPHTETHPIHNHTSQVRMDNHGTLIARSSSYFHDADYIILG